MQFPVKSASAASEKVGALVLGVREGRVLDDEGRALDKATSPPRWPAPASRARRAST